MSFPDLLMHHYLLEFNKIIPFICCTGNRIAILAPPVVVVNLSTADGSTTSRQVNIQCCTVTATIFQSKYFLTGSHFLEISESSNFVKYQYPVLNWICTWLQLVDLIDVTAACIPASFRIPFQPWMESTGGPLRNKIPQGVLWTSPPSNLQRKGKGKWSGTESGCQTPTIGIYTLTLWKSACAKMQLLLVKSYQEVVGISRSYPTMLTCTPLVSWEITKEAVSQDWRNQCFSHVQNWKKKSAVCFLLSSVTILHHKSTTRHEKAHISTTRHWKTHISNTFTLKPTKQQKQHRTKFFAKNITRSRKEWTALWSVCRSWHFQSWPEHSPLTK